MSVIKQAVNLVDELIIAVGINPEKNTMFTVEERMSMIAQAVSDLPNVGVRCFENMYLVDFAHQCKANILVRGIRSSKDYEFERGMYDINAAIADPSIMTVYLFPPAELVNVSSSMVKGLIGPQHWDSVVKRYVPTGVMHCIEQKVKGSIIK